MASVSSTAPLSGYRLMAAAASAMTLSTDGSGPNGDSFEESLTALPPGRRRGLAGLVGSELSSTGRNRGNCADILVLLDR